MTENFLPLEGTGDKEPIAVVGDYIFEPTKQEIVEQLIPKSLKTQLFKAILDSHASEHGARMTAMHKATDNADALVQGLVAGQLYQTNGTGAAPLNVAGIVMIVV